MESENKVFPSTEQITKAFLEVGKRNVYLLNRLKELSSKISEVDNNKTDIMRILDDLFELKIISEDIFYKIINKN